MIRRHITMAILVIVLRSTQPSAAATQPSSTPTQHSSKRSCTGQALW